MPSTRSSRHSGIGGPQTAPVGLILLVVCAVGAIYSVCATISQSAYKMAKYGRGKSDFQVALNLCLTAERLYPYNFYVQQYICERAYYDSFEASSTEEAAELLDVSRRWCDRGLHLNYYDRTLRLRRVVLLARRDLERAVREMEQYVDWHFWHPHNHAILASLYAKSGDFDKAEQSLFLVKQSKYYEDAVRSVERAKQKFLDSLHVP
jgi:hypothetical protein